MASLVRFIERRLRLKVNAAKSAVARPSERHFLGFCLGSDPETETVEVLPSKRSEQRIKERIREMTLRRWGQSLRDCIRPLNAYLDGWFGFFVVCTAGVLRLLHNLDAHIRRRLRALQLRQWKTKRTRARRLIKLGVKPTTAWRNVYDGRKSLWALSHAPAVDRGLRNAYFAERGLVPLEQRWWKAQERFAAPVQLSLPWDMSRS